MPDAPSLLERAQTLAARQDLPVLPQYLGKATSFELVGTPEAPRLRFVISAAVPYHEVELDPSQVPALVLVVQQFVDTHEGAL